MLVLLCTGLAAVTNANSFVLKSEIGSDSDSDGGDVSQEQNVADDNTGGEVEQTTQAVQPEVTTESTTQAPSNPGNNNDNNPENSSNPGEEQTTGEGTGITIDTSVIEGMQEQKAEFESKKEEAQMEIDNLKRKQQDIMMFAEEVDAKIKEYELEISDMEAEKLEKEQTIENLKTQIEEAKIKQEEQYAILKDHIRNAYENGNYSYADVIVQAASFSDIINKTEYVEQINAYDLALLDEYIETRTTMANKSALLQVNTESLAKLTEKYEDEKAGLELLYNSKQQEIDGYNDSIGDLEALIEKLDKQSEQIDNQIAAIEAAALLQQLGPATYTGGSFAWPSPSTSITSKFGPRNRPIAGASTYHKGVDIGTPIGSSVFAAAGGTVIYVGYMSSAGNAVMIDHGSGITTCYYHLSQPLVSVGQTVSQAQVIALSGNTGVSTGPHLHFSVRVNGQYVDPMSYF